jgi:alpha-tubulin suppressor-like RCC1 family protein
VPPDLENVVAVSCGPLNTVALTQEGKIVCWGSQDEGRCSIPNLANVISVSCGCHMVALTDEGKLIAWGSSHAGQCNVPDDLTVMQLSILF